MRKIVKAALARSFAMAAVVPAGAALAAPNPVAWRAASAYGTGKLHLERLLCEPAAAPGCTNTFVRWASVRLTDVKVHAGKRYFAAMTARFWSKGKELTRRLAVKAGTGPGPSVWPYL